MHIDEEIADFPAFLKERKRKKKEHVVAFSIDYLNGCDSWYRTGSEPEVEGILHRFLRASPSEDV